MAGGSLAQPLARRGSAQDGPRRACAPVAASAAACVATGVLQPLLMSQVRFAGLADPVCQIYLVPHCFGMACTGLLVVCNRCPGLRTLPLHRSACIALVVVVSQSLNRTGNVLAGSAVYAVVYSSSTIWNALLSRMIMKRVLTPWQWCGIVVVVIGLAITSVDAKIQGERIFLGAAMITVGALLHSLGHVLSEFVSVRGSRIPPYINSCVQGIVCCTVASMWQCTYTVTHWEKIVVPMEEARTSWGYAFLLLCGLAIGNFVHAATFFYLLTSIGVVSTGLLKSLQAVAVFCLSHLLYCDRDQSQCFTPVKGISLLIVVCGMLCYVAATGAAQTRSHAGAQEK